MRKRPLCQFVESARFSAKRTWPAVALFAIAAAVALLLQACTSANGGGGIAVKTGGKASPVEAALNTCNQSISQKASAARSDGGSTSGTTPDRKSGSGLTVVRTGARDSEGRICFTKASEEDGDFRTSFILTADVDALASPATTDDSQRVRPANGFRPVPRPRAAVPRHAGRGRPGVAVQPRVMIEKDGKPISEEDAKKTVENVNVICGAAITRLFGRFVPPLPLQLNFVPANQKDPEADADFPQLALAIDDANKIHFKDWRSEATFDAKVTATEKCPDEPDRRKCNTWKAFRNNEAFCRDLAKMTGHFLGVSDPGCASDAAADKTTPNALDFMKGSKWTEPARATQTPPTAPPATPADAKPADATKPAAPTAGPKAKLPAFWDRAQLGPKDFNSVFRDACPDLSKALNDQATPQPPAQPK